MKNLLAVIVLFITSTCFAQQPPVAPCLTNIVVVITNSLALNTGSTNINQNTQTTIQFADCQSTDTTVGFAMAQCDPGTDCSYGEVIRRCVGSYTIPIVMPAGVKNQPFELNAFSGCCSIVQVNHPGEGCDQTGGCK